MKFIDIVNVKHGDFGIYYNTEQGYICVLDCGTSQPNSCLHTSCLTPKRIIDSVSYRISSSTHVRDILISHYHEDHFNGIGIFKRYGLPFFRNMYVPYIDFKADYTKRFLYSMCLLKATSDVLRIPFALLQRFSSLFLDNYAQNYIMCHGGNILREIKDGKGVVAEVLWPPKYIYGKSEELEKFIKKLEDCLRKHDLKATIEKTEKYFSEIQKQLNSREFSSLNLDNRERERQIKVDINEIFGRKESNERNHKHDERKEMESVFRDLKDAVKNFLDALSIIFRINNELVWMGDTTDEVLAILKQDLQGNIKYFKLPHHGSRDISNLSISASKFVVSISDGKHYHGYNYNPINVNNLEKAREDNTIIFCTDGHRYCHNNGFPFYRWNYLPSETYPCFGNVYCSRNTVVRIDL